MSAKFLLKALNLLDEKHGNYWCGYGGPITRQTITR